LPGIESVGRVISLPTNAEDILLARKTGAPDEEVVWEALLADPGAAENPRALGLADGSELAFRIIGDLEDDGRWVVQFPSFEEAYPDE
jgi:hypothetical protein